MLFTINTLMRLTMKWNVEKASRVIDAIIGMAVAYFLVDVLWVDGSIDSDLIMPLYVGLVSMLAYRIGIWSGRKLERMDIEPVQSVRRLDNQGQQPKPPTTPMPPLKKPRK